MAVRHMRETEGRNWRQWAYKDRIIRMSWPHDQKMEPADRWRRSLEARNDMIEGIDRGEL